MRAVSAASRGADGLRAPAGHQFHADGGHFQRDEMVTLAHVEAPRPGDIARVGKVGVLLGPHRRAGRSSSARAECRPGAAWQRRGKPVRRARPATCRSGTPRSQDRARARPAAARQRSAWHRSAMRHRAPAVPRRSGPDRRRHRPTNAPTRWTPAPPAPRRAARCSAVTASVQSPFPGRCTTSTVKPCASARLIHSSTGDE